jgi:hypothetical protein
LAHAKSRLRYDPRDALDCARRLPNCQIKAGDSAMRVLWIPTLLVALGAPLAAYPQSGASALQGQSTATQLTRGQALHDVEHAGYTSVTKLTLGPDGTWTAMTSRGAVKIDAAGEVTQTP